MPSAQRLMKMWKPLGRLLTPERRLVVSTEALKSPLGTAAPTFQSHFSGEPKTTQLPKLSPACCGKRCGACSELRRRKQVVGCMVYLVSRSSTDS